MKKINSRPLSCQDGWHIFSRKRRSAGVTLVELMIAMTLALAIIAAVGYVYVSGNQGYKVQDQASRMQEDARYVIQTITRDIQMAGVFGCVANRVAGGAGLQTSFELLARQPVMTTNTDWIMLSGADNQDVERFVNPTWTITVIPSAAAASHPALPNGVRNTANPGNRLPGTDVLMIMRGSDDAQPVTGYTNTSLTIPQRIPGTGTNPTMVVSNCAYSALFKPTVQASGSQVVLRIDNGLNENVNAPVRGAPDFNNNYGPGGDKTADSVVTLFSPAIYYIARAPATGPINERVPQLRRLGIVENSAVNTGAWAGTNNATVIASGVETLDLSFDVRDAAGKVATVELAAMTPASWVNVVAVRGDFRLVSTSDGTRTESTTRNVGGVSVTDNRLSQTYGFVAGVRSRQGSAPF
jgi:type IV pilus assembly protein PilW